MTKLTEKIKRMMKMMRTNCIAHALKIRKSLLGPKKVCLEANDIDTFIHNLLIILKKYYNGNIC